MKNRKWSIHDWAWLINTFLLVLMLHFVWNSDADKSILILAIFYPALIFINFLIWIILRKSNNQNSKGYLGTAIGLIAVIPLVLLFTIYD